MPHPASAEVHAYSTSQGRPWFRLALWLLAGFYWLLGRLYFRPCPQTRIGHEHWAQCDKGPRRAVMTCWHSDMYYALWTQTGKPIVVMASRSDAGSVAAALVEKIGGMAVRGSSTRGGKEALTQLIDQVRAGRWGIIVADAPRGPIHKSKAGPVVAAQRAGVPILPNAFGYKRKWTFGSWDRAEFPKPFTPVVWMIGEPIWVPENATPEEVELKRQELDAKMLALKEKASRFWQQPTGE